MLTRIRKPFSTRKLRYFVTKQNECRRQFLSDTRSHEYFNAIDKAHEILEGEKDLAKNVPSCVVVRMQSVGKSRMLDHINEKLPDLNTMLEDELRRCKVELEKLGRHPYPLESIALRDLQCIEESVDNAYEAFQPIQLKEQQKFIYISQKGDSAGHMIGSSVEKPIRKNDKNGTIETYRTFKKQWLEETGHSWPSKCSTKGCSNEPTVGAHVFINKKEYAYLVPMCHQCNMDRNKFLPDENIDNHLSFPIQLDEGTLCAELTHLHISEQNKCANIEYQTWLEMLERFNRYNKEHKSPFVPNKYEYKDREGHCNVPKYHKEDGKTLGEWLNTQRRNKKRGTLDTVKEKQLEELGIVWDVFESEWDENIKLLMEYKDREGHCNVPQDHKEDGKNLGEWFSSQRKDETGKFYIEREQKIEDALREISHP